MDMMKKTLPTMAKAALAVLLTWGGLGQAGAQGEYRDIVTPQDYESASESDWVYTGSQMNGGNDEKRFKSKIIAGDATYGSYAANEYGKTGTSSMKDASFSKVISFTQTPGTGYIDKALSEVGYNMEFDFSITGGTGYNRTNDNQLMVLTGSEPEADTKYEGSDFLFSLYQHIYPEISSTGSDYWVVNDTSKSIQLGKGKWFHLKLVITAQKCDYTITGENGEEDVDNGSLTLSSLPEITRIWTLLGKRKSSFYFDNFKVYDYVGTGNTPTAPSISPKEDHITSKTYTITFEEGNTLYYQLPGDTGPTKFEGSGNSVDVTAKQSGTLEAYTERGVSQSSHIKEDVIVAPSTLLISTKSGLASFSSAYAVKVPDDVYVYIIDKTNATDDKNNIIITKLDTHVIPAVTPSDETSKECQGQGVFLYKDGGGTINLDYDTSSADASLYGNNILYGTGSSTYTVQQDTDWKDYNTTSAIGDVWVLRKDVKEMGPVYPNVEIPRNKAYYRLSSISGSGSSSKLNLVFDDAITGIHSVKNDGGSVADDVLFNLNGQRVDDAYKGMVIKKGKKYVNR